tara:strand:+ start:3215 stop:3919 length:705 start_codon:yes stop_codon:yes gene_type:complete
MTRKFKEKKRKKTRKRPTRSIKKPINRPMNFIFGYGSLINTISSKTTCKNMGKPIPVELSKKCGYHRLWICKKSQYGNYSFLGIVKSKNPQNINGTLTPIFTCIKKFDKREKGYKRIKIKYDPRKNILKSKYALPNYPCNIYIYIITGKIDYPTMKCPISQSYLDIVISGCLEYGEAFTKKFINTTSNWKNKKNEVFWVNDRHINKRSWVKNMNNKKIDTLTKSVIPTIYKLRI